MKLVFILLHCALTLFAANLTPQEIESRLSAYQDLKDFQARFRQTKRLKAMGIDLKSEGELSVIRPEKVIWKVEKPSPLVLTLEKDQVELVQNQGVKQRWSLQSGASEQDLKGLSDLVAWLRLDAKAIAQAYTLSEDKPGEILCVPRRADEHSPFHQLRMFLGKKGHLEKLLLEERSGDELDISFSAPRKLR